MTSKNLFFKLMKEDIRRRLWAVAIVLLAWFFIFPVRIALIPGDYETMNQSEEIKKMAIALRAENWFQIDNGFVITMVLFGAVVLGISSFSYLHSKKKVDFYHSIPIRRELLFFVNFVDGIIIMFVPYLIMALVGAGMAMSFGASPGLVLKHIAETMSFHFVYYVLIYATVVVAMMMTGNIFLGILGVGVFFAYVPAVVMLIEGMCTLFLETYVTDYLKFSWALKLSPVGAYFQALDALQFENFAEGVKMPILPGGSLLLVLAVAVLLMGVALWLYQKRPSEAAGKAMAFPISRTPIKMLIVIASTLGGGILFAVIRETLPWMLFGLIFTAVFTHCLIEILYQFDFRKLFSHMGHLAVCLLCSLLIFGGFYFDITGYDTYLPKEQEVESSYISAGWNDDWVRYNYMEGTVASELNWTWSVGRRDYVEEHMFLTDTGSVLEIAKQGIQSLGIDSEEIAYRDRTYVTVGYRMKSGREVLRYYRIPIANLQDSYAQVVDIREFKEGNYPIYQQKPENIYKMYAEFQNGKEAGLQQIDEAVFQQVLEAYRIDFANLTIAEQTKEKVIGKLVYVPIENMGDRAVFERELENSTSYVARRLLGVKNNEEYHISYPMYSSFTNTLDLLSSYGINIGEETWKPDTCVVEKRYYGENSYEVLQKVEQIERRESLVVAVYPDEERVTYTYTDPQEVEALYETAVKYRYAELNQWYPYLDNVSANFSQEEDTENGIWCQFSKEFAPAFLIEDITIEGEGNSDSDTGFAETAEVILID